MSSRCFHVSSARVLRISVALCFGLIGYRLGEGNEPNLTKAEAHRLIHELTTEIENLSEPDPLLFEERGDAFMALEEPARAFEDYSNAIQRTFRRLPYRLFEKRVAAAVEIGNYHQALDDTKALTRASVTPPQAAPFAMLALILARTPDDKVRNPAESLAAAKRAASMDGDRRASVIVELALAAAHSVNGEFEKAVKHQENAISAVEGDVPVEMRAQLDAYKAGKEYPFQRKGKK